MLGKLWKQEVKTQGRTICGMYAVLVFATVLLAVLNMASRYIGGGMIESIFMFSCILYMLSLFVAVVVNFVYLCFNFHQSMYSQQGYLTHTLPVKTTQVLNVKIAVSFGFLFLTGIICILSFMGIGLAADGMQIGQLLQLAGQLLREAENELGVSGAVFVLFLLVMAVLGCLNALLMFFAGSSIGQLSHRSKGACGIAAGIALYYCSQILSLIVAFLGYFVYEKLFGVWEPKWIMAGGCLLAFVWTVVYYMICRVVVQKHLNLE